MKTTPLSLLLALPLFFNFPAGILNAQNGLPMTYRLLMRDIIINSDLWTEEPEILSANYAFENIVGVPGEKTEVLAAGGTWNDIVSCSDGTTPPRRVLTSSTQPQNVAALFGSPVLYADALPVVFSWPVLPSTLDPADFRMTLNTGEQVTPAVVSIVPNFEYNERHVAVAFGQFGNRLLPGEPGAVYVETVEIVEDDTPLMLVGPDGPVSIVGQSIASTHPYVAASGPTLIAAKLSLMNTQGEAAPGFLSGYLPNHGSALFGEQASYRLRLLTSGGISPDGVLGIRPDQFSTFFRIHAQHAEGQDVLLTETDFEYDLGMGSITILGLADTGRKQGSDNGTGGLVAYAECYGEDHDNYLDIILTGDEAAIRRITAVEIPAQDGYLPVYNPGGPGMNPTPGVTYTAAGPPVTRPVMLALDDPKTVTYCVNSIGAGSLGPDLITTPTSGFFASGWFGVVYTEESPWLWSPGLGWIYPTGNDVTSLWIWSATQGWLWTVRDTYPWAWSNDLSAWLYIRE